MAALASRGSDSASEPSASATAAAAAAAAAARQMSVDAEAIKIVIHDVYDRSPRRVSLRRDPNDKGHRCKCELLYLKIYLVQIRVYRGARWPHGQCASTCDRGS
jgi:hypothetical protein